MNSYEDIQDNTSEECKDNRLGKENPSRDNEPSIAQIKILVVRRTLLSFDEISHLEEVSGQWWAFVVNFSAFFCLHSVQVGPGGRGLKQTRQLAVCVYSFNLYTLQSS